jgi:hypothetical protein
MSTSLVDPGTAWPATDGSEAPWPQGVAGGAVVDTAAEVGGAPVVRTTVVAAAVGDADVVAVAAGEVLSADVAVDASVVADDPSSSPEQPAAISSATTIASPVVASLR